MAHKTFTNTLTLKTDTRITADRILECIEILRFQGLVPHQIKFGMVDKCPDCGEPTWGLFMAEDEGVEIEEGEPLGICLQCNATIFVDENGKLNARIISSQDLLRGLRIGKGK